MLDVLASSIYTRIRTIDAKERWVKYTDQHSKLGTDIHQHLPTLYAMAVNMKAKVVIELGVRTGESTIPFLEAMQVTDGHLWSVDVDPCIQAKQKMKNYGLDGRWTFTVLGDIEYGMHVWDKSKKADIIFIDTSHEYQQTKKEIEVFEPLLRPGGIMMFHDTVSFPAGVLKPILEFMGGHPKYKFENFQNCHGLGIITKPA